MKQLKKIQQEHFRRMTPKERKSAIEDAERQLSAISMSDSPAADHKREELQARIDFCQKLNLK